MHINQSFWLGTGVIDMEKNVKDNPEYRMKRQWLIVGFVCLAVMAFLTTFLMKRYRQKTENVFSEVMEESLMSAHSEALSELESFLGAQGESADMEEAWEQLDNNESNIFHYLCDSQGEILAGDMRVFDIKYTVAAELRSIRVKNKDIEAVENVLANLESGQPYIFSELEKSDVYLAASRMEDRDCILISGYRSGQMKNYRTAIINGNRTQIGILLGCMAIIILLLGHLYLKQQKRVMKGQARYDILSEFSDTVLFEYDCLDKTLVFTPNIATLFGLKEVGQLR